MDALGSTCCPLCGGECHTEFFQAARAPVTCASIFATRTEALQVPSGAVHLCFCNGCGLVFNRSFDSQLGALGAQYESSQAASAHFGAFAQSLARDWVQRHALRGARVLEVGCGSGDFLQRLVREGVGAAIGLDPYCDPHSNRSAHIELRQEAFDDNTATIEADALVCRHTLEHVQEVGRFLRLVHNWAAQDPKRIVLFELPGSERIWRERAFWDVYYEHCNYFSLDAVRFAFVAAGFEVLSALDVYDGQYVVVEARASSGNSPSKRSPDALSAELLACQQFGVDVQRAVSRCKQRLRRLAASKPVVLWQGASKTVGFLTALEEISAIACAVDLSPQRHDRFLPGSGVAVKAPEALIDMRPEHVVLMNPIYLNEVRAHLASLGVHCVVHTVNELLAE